MSSYALMRDVDSSNLARSEKSAVRRMLEKAMGAGPRAKMHVAATAHTIRQGGGAVITGLALGVADAQLPGGLDHRVGTTTVPVDGIVAALALAGGVGLAHEEYGADLRNAGTAAAGIFAFRKGREFWLKKKSQIHGESDYGAEDDDMSRDPIVEAARRLR